MLDSKVTITITPRQAYEQALRLLRMICPFSYVKDYENNKAMQKCMAGMQLIDAKIL